MDLSLLVVFAIAMAFMEHWKELHKKDKPKTVEEKFGEALANYLKDGIKIVKVEGGGKG
ncbi:MAG: hypothetical protein ACO331_06565 [Prochlorothrix sp.]